MAQFKLRHPIARLHDKRKPPKVDGYFQGHGQKKPVRKKPKQPVHKKKGGGHKQPFDLTAPLDKRTFQREREADVRLQYGDLERQIHRETAASNFRYGPELNSWYDAARADIARLTDQGTAARTAMMNQLAGAQSAAGAQDAAARDAMMERLAKDAQLRGAALDPNVERGQIDAANARAAQSSGVMATLGGQAINQDAFLRNRAAISFTKQREEQEREAARQRQRDEDMRVLQREKGDYRTKYRKDARSQEREYKLGQATLGSKNAYSKAIVKQAQIGQHKSVDVNNNYSGLPKRPHKFDFNYHGAGGGSGGSGYSVREAVGLARQHQRGKSSFPSSRSALVDYLVGRGVDEKVAKKAANRMGVSPPKPSRSPSRPRRRR